MLGAICFTSFRPELADAWQLAHGKPFGATKFLNKYAALSRLVIDEWLLDESDESTRSLLSLLAKRRHDRPAPVL